MFTITNTVTGKKELFSPRIPGQVSMYVCGITPYDRSHIGHARSFVVFDLLYRWLVFLGYKVFYCRNFTDIDDKLINKAIERFHDPLRYKEIADEFIAQYQDEVAAFNCKKPDFEPCVTDNIPAIITFIEQLIAKGYAYQVDGDVYFEVSKFPEYGKLSKQKRDELKSGARVDVDSRKRDPLDFALWKSEANGTYWKSPWGYGRPGWHIECSALAERYLAEQIDIHGGGRDLQFPHHENEIAQTESKTGKEFARYWVHNGFVQINKEKMSKSLGNILTIHELCKRYDPMVLRYYFLTHHYRAPLDFSFEDLDAAQKSYKRLCALLHDVKTGSFGLAELNAMPICKRMIEFLSDDLNTPGMFGAVFENLDTLKSDQAQMRGVKQILHDVLGLFLVPLAEKQIEMTPEIQALLDERDQARANKDWKRSDEIRDQLKNMGYEVRDSKAK